jgi:phage tail sheath gpL-like
MQFKDIPSDWRVPGSKTEFDLVSGSSGLVPSSEKIVFIAQKTMGGTALIGEPVEVFDVSSAKELLGSKSIALLMVNAAFLANTNLPIFVCPLEDAVGSSAAVLTTPITIVGSGQNVNYVFEIANRVYSVASKDFATMRTSIKDAIDGDILCPFVCTWTSVTADQYNMVLTAQNKGTLLNETQLKISYKALEIGTTTITIGATVVTSGAVDPGWSSVFSNCEGGEFTQYVPSYNTQSDLVTLRNQVELLSDGINQKNCFLVFAANKKTYTEATIKTLCATTINSWLSICFYDENNSSYSFEIAAAASVVLAKQPRPGDPVNNYSLVGINVPSIKDRLSNETKIQSYLKNGVAPLHVINGNSCIVQARTTYATTAGGGYVDKLTYFETGRSLFYIRTNVKSMENTKYTNRKNNAETRANLKEDVYAILSLLEGPDFEITQNVDANKEGIIVVQDPVSAGRVNVLIPANIVPGLHVIANQVRLI